MSYISYVEARQILDSRGNPTVEVDVFVLESLFKCLFCLESHFKCRSHLLRVTTISEVSLFRSSRGQGAL